MNGLVGDALRLLGHLPEHELGERAANAVGILALVAGQDVEPADGSDGRDGRWRITEGTAPDRLISVVDPEARHVHKTRAHRRDGFKAHLAVEPETGLFTAVALRPGAGAPTMRPSSAWTCSPPSRDQWRSSVIPPTPPARPAGP